MSDQGTLGLHFAAARPATAHAAADPGRIVPRRGLQRAEPLLVIVLTAAFYVALYGQLPYHDAARFAAQVDSGRFVFDIAHVLLQPVTLLWHRALGFGETATASQKHISTAATALAAGIFDAMLLHLRVDLRRRLGATLLLVASCSVMTLAPSAHMKLVAFPFVTGSLAMLACWEQAGRPRPGIRWIAIAAALLGLAAALLVSALATAPFASVAVMLVSRRHGCTTVASLRRAALFAAICGATFALLVCIAFVLFSGEPLTLAGLLASVQGKADLKPAGYGWGATAARLLFGTVNNLIAAPAMGSIGRAWIGGAIASLRPYAATLASQLLPWLATLLLLGVVYVRAGLAARRGAPCLMPLAFLCGAQAWTVYYGLIDPEHWFQLTAPTLLLAATLFRPAVGRILLPVWAAITLAVNLAIIGLPTARYPLQRYQAELRARFTPNDLLISFAAYPGGAYLGSFDLHGIPRLQIDQAFRQAGSVPALFAGLAAAVDATLSHGGGVFVFSALDPYDWNAPWGDLPRRGLTKARLSDFLNVRYRVNPIGTVAELKTWQLTARSP